MNDEIRHDGIIESIDGERMRVRIVQVAACLHCKIAGHCNSSDSKEKIVDVEVTNPENYAIGDKVILTMSGKLGLKAVLFAFVIPVIIASAAVYATILITAADGLYPVKEPYNEGAGAVAGLLSFIVYYTGLSFFRNSLKGEFRFRIQQ